MRKGIPKKRKNEPTGSMYFDILCKQVGRLKAREIIKFSKDPLANIFKNGIQNRPHPGRCKSK